MRILFTGGFTLGSVTPLLAVAEELRELRIKNQELRIELIWVGTRNGPERKLVSDAGIKFSWILAPKWRRYFDARNLMVPLWFGCSVFWSAILLLMRRPEVIVTAGGFVGVPIVWAAWLLRIPCLLHNQDVRFSLANKLVAPCVTRITYALPGTVPRWWRKKTVWTGNPVREFLFKGDRERGLRVCGFNNSHPAILVIGGGTGAKRLNEIAAEALPELTKKYQVIHLTGKGKKLETRNLKLETKNKFPVSSFQFPNYCPFEFVTHEIADLYAASDLVITRAGMSVLSELAALGKPMIIVPIPESHQEDNARYFEKKRAAIVLDQRELTSAALAGIVEKLMGELGTIQEMSERAREIMRPDAAKSVAGEIKGLAKN
ncbi:UDP-N-acetylglucosamine--N-acetylmuramyl-(pentapeptide) pyrophosphoryl-undecaprenol N-acetylglucosamine transferase [Candidatus Uhrbacteria bacterium]|nr:UDP-N-acetylglucosamine--N-acetylmuramyl-(pentapeptide) pyrophosphoryl-undecaprenol N-acetylglucosamine transferase [Candidatus Uhrbacteria bacterium]